MRRWRVALVGATVLLVAACEGRVTDPQGDSLGNDIVEAGVEFGNAQTRLWVRGAPGEDLDNVKSWLISTDGDTTEELTVRVGDLYSLSDYWFVRDENAAMTRCAGYAEDIGRVDADRWELVIDSRCLNPASEPDRQPPVSLRFQAYAYDRTGDNTEWSGPIARS